MGEDRASLVPPATVRLGVERELKALAEDGRHGPNALRDAVEITAAKIRNAGILIEHQAHDGRCHICGDPLDDTRPVVAVMQAKPGRPLFLHHGACCQAHGARRTALVAAIVAAARDGADERTGAAA